jgi:hypothetical protein
MEPISGNFFESLDAFEWGIGVWDEFQVVMEFSIQGFRWALPIFFMSSFLLGAYDARASWCLYDPGKTMFCFQGTGRKFVVYLERFRFWLMTSAYQVPILSHFLKLGASLPKVENMCTLGKALKLLWKIFFT